MRLALVRACRPHHSVTCSRGLSTQAEAAYEKSPAVEDGPKYPPIISASKEQQEKDAWHAKITSLPTFEQKVMEINMPKAYGFYSCVLRDDEFQINGLPFLKYATKTHISEDFPHDYYACVAKSSAVAAARLAPDVKRLILLHYGESTLRDEGSKTSREKSFLKGLHRLLSSCLPRPLGSSVTHNPRILAGWFVGGLDNVGEQRREWMHFTQEERDKKLWVRNLWLDREEPFMGDVVVRSHSSPTMVVREKDGLPPAVDLHAVPTLPAVPTPTEEESKVPLGDDGRRDPEVYGYEMTHKPFMLCPGYWPGEACPHGRLYYHPLRAGPSVPPHLRSTALLQQLLIASHAQALSQAAIFGFTPVSELTYPVVHQGVATDGQTYHRLLYQLNTSLLTGTNATDPGRTNWLWVSPPQRLWEGVRGGSVGGLNLLLLSDLAGLYLRPPAPPQPAPAPHLAPYKYLWEHPGPACDRALFHKRVNTLKSEQFWAKNKPVLMAWEKFYKLDHNTMPQENNAKRFFEGHRFRLLPEQRTCRHVMPASIKVADRPLGKKDPVKREPLIEPLTLVDRRAKGWKNWRYHYKYTYPVEP